MVTDLFGQLLLFSSVFQWCHCIFWEPSISLAWASMSCITLCVRQLFSRVWLFATPQSMGFSRQEYWSGLPFSSPRGSSGPRIELESPCLPHCKRILYLLSHWGSPMWYQLKLPFQPQFCNSLFSSTDLPLYPDFINFLLAYNDVKM